MKYIVLRHGADVPLDKRALAYEGVWIDATHLPAAAPVRLEGMSWPAAYAEPTDRVEYREDGEAAEVWEIHLYEPDPTPIDYGARGGQPFGYA